jgi:hypothetical protein
VIWYEALLVVALLGLLGCPGNGSDSDENATPPSVDIVSTPVTDAASTPPRPTSDAAIAAPRTPILGQIPHMNEEELLEVDYLLSLGDVREVTRYTGPIETSPIVGQILSADHNSIRYGIGERFGIGLQVWTFRRNADTAREFNRQRETYIAPTENRGLGDVAFNSEFDNLHQLVVMSRRANTIFAISCDTGTCGGSLEILDQLAGLVLDRL